LCIQTTIELSYIRNIVVIWYHVVPSRTNVSGTIDNYFYFIPYSVPTVTGGNFVYTPI